MTRRTCPIFAIIVFLLGFLAWTAYLITADGAEISCFYDDGFAVGLSDGRTLEASPAIACPHSEEWEGGYVAGFYYGLQTSVAEGSGHPYEYIDQYLNSWPRCLEPGSTEWEHC